MKATLLVFKSCSFGIYLLINFALTADFSPPLSVTVYINMQLHYL